MQKNKRCERHEKPLHLKSSGRVTTYDTRRERAVNVTLTALFFMFLWNLDMSVTSIMSGLNMTNGFFSVNPAKMYHLCLCGLSVVLTTAILYNWR